MSVKFSKYVGILLLSISTIGSHVSCYYAITVKTSAFQLNKYTQILALIILIHLGYTYLDFTLKYLYNRKKLWVGPYGYKWIDFLSYSNLIRNNFNDDENKLIENDIESKKAIFHIIFGYFIMIYTFAASYQFIWLWDSQAFGKIDIHIFNALYFSSITSATIGYGDIVPCSALARIVVCLEIFFSLFYVFIVFSLLPETLKKVSKNSDFTDLKSASLNQNESDLE
jgi:hypothetical protein